MIKVETMKRYEAETGKQAVDCLTEYPFDDYTRWLEAKASAYDRLMSGGKKTLKELANIFGKPVATQKDGDAYVYMGCPVLNKNGDWVGLYEGTCISMYLIDFTGDWKDSLTLPDGWEGTDD